jgi:site-specific DNA recombinase
VEAAVYTRISQDAAGQRLGVTRQLEDCEALAERLGWEVVARFDDNDLSAFNGKVRPGFEAMLDAMKRGEFGGLICWHPDRLYRSMKDLERLIDIADDRNVQLRTVNGGDLDLSTSSGRMLARILGSVARQESEHKGERQRRANAQARAAGKWNKAGHRVFGYSRDGVPLEPEATAVRQAADDVLAGRSLRSIAIEWNARNLRSVGGKRWDNLRLRRMLMNPVYCGLVRYQGRLAGRGEWEPLIDEATHRGLVAYLSDPARKPGSSFERKYMLSGVAVCGKCGQRMYAMVPHGPERWVYGCRNGHHVARMGQPLDEYTELVLFAYLSDPETRERLSALMAEGGQVDVSGLQAQREGLDALLDALTDMFTRGEIDSPQFRRGTTDLRAQRTAIDSQLAELSRRSPAAELVAAGEAAEKHWRTLSPDLRGKVVDELMTVTVKPTPRGIKGVFVDRGTGRRIINTDYVNVKPKP